MFDPRRGRAAKEKAGSLRMAKVTVNGAEQEFGGDGGMPLLWYLRDELQLTGSKYGCGTGLCGACTVHVNGEPVRACITAMQDVDGARSRPSRGSTRAAIIRCSSPGANSTCRSAASARPARSCRPPAS